MLQPRGKGLLGATLRYPYEVGDEEIYFGDINEVEIPKDMLALAEHILESKGRQLVKIPRPLSRDHRHDQ
jgi:DNA end-binding protein Ku